MSNKKELKTKIHQLELENSRLRNELLLTQGFVDVKTIPLVRKEISFTVQECKKSIANAILSWEKHFADTSKYYKPDQNPANSLHGLDYSNLKYEQ